MEEAVILSGPLLLFPFKQLGSAPALTYAGHTAKWATDGHPRQLEVRKETFASGLLDTNTRVLQLHIIGG